MLTINATDLNNTSTMSTLTPPPDPILTSGQGIIDNALTSLPTAQSTVDANTTNTSTNVDKISELMKSLLPKTADTNALNESLGVNAEKANYDKYNQNLNDINANISGLSAEAKAIPLQVQQNNANTGATDAGVAPQTTGKLRENAIKALTQSALADIATANINNSKIRYDAAQDKVKQAIDLKYQPIETEIQNLKDQLALNKQYITDPAEKKLADQQAKVLAERTRVIDEQKQTEKDVNAIKLEVAKNGGDVSKITSTDLAGAINQAGKSLRETNIQKLDDGSLVVVDKQGHVLNRISGGNNNIVLPSTVVNTVTTSNGTKPVTGYKLNAGDDPYVVAHDNGIDLATLQQLNPQVTDWHNLPVGTVLNLPNKDEAWLNGKTQEQVQAYNSLPDADKASVKQLVNGDALLTDIVKSRGKTTQAQINKLITQATKIDPNFSINANKQRFTYKTQFNNPNGKEQGQINAINTGLGHLAEFKTAADALGNTIVLPYNKLVNYLDKNAGDPKVTNLNTVITALAGELASVYKGGGAPTDQETAEWRQTILSNFSKAQTAGVASTTASLIGNKLNTLGNSYKNIMGKYPDAPLVNADVVQQLINSGVDASGITSKLKAQGYDVPELNADTSSINSFLSGTKSTSNTSSLDSLWGKTN